MSVPAPDASAREFARLLFGMEPGAIVLASRSPRRRELLARLGVVAEIVPADVDESEQAGEGAVSHAERLALEKARVVGARRPDRLVVAADTVVTLDDRLLGKPRDREHAREMLRMLSGRSHAVVTGVAVMRDGARSVGSERTTVTFRPLNEREIDAYVASGEPDDKAGAYGAQALGAAFISRLEGCYYNVVGLPIVRLLALARELDARAPFARGERR